jgi:Na+/melibiose symporter-like transporter
VSAAGLAVLSSVWFALYAQWTTVVPTIVPNQIGIMLGEHDPAKEAWTGSILALGSLMAMIVAPIAGALSDRSSNRHGRRRPFLLWGMAGSCASLLLLLPFWQRGEIVGYAAAFLLLQSAWNWVAGAYAGLIPDVVPDAAQGEASAWLNIMTVAGTASGNAIAFLLYTPERPLPAFLAFVALNLGVTLLTLRYVREQPPGPASRFDLSGFIGSFYLSPRRYPAFYRVLLTRLLAGMGTWPVLTFLAFYLGDVIGVAEPTRVVPALLGAGAIAAVPASVWAIRLSERFGLVRVTQMSNWVLAACAICLVLIALRPSAALALPVLLVFAAFFGAYQAADWALALRVLPDRAASGKDMGIWHISMVIPQILGPAATGWMISAVKASSGAPIAYTLAFAMAAIWLLLSAALMGGLRS